MKDQPSEPASPGWASVGINSLLDQPVATPVPASGLGKLDNLPIDELGWSRFERLQWVILRDVEGLRSAQIYGDPGQKQYGLDLIALAADGTGTALQSKDYQKFHPSDLEKAVRKFQTTVRPFQVQRLIIGVSSDVRSTRVHDRLIELRGEVTPVDLELWDKKDISEMLRGRPEIVIQFFGEETARRFCRDFTAETITVPHQDAVAVREAIARTPEVATGARELLDQAADETDPTSALALVDRARELLNTAGYPAHASALETTRSDLLVRLSQADKAARTFLEQVWQACARGRTQAARQAHHHLAGLARSSDQPDDPAGRVRAMTTASEAVLSLQESPLADDLPDPDAWSSLEPVDRVRLLVIAGETALANGNLAWVTSSANHLDACLPVPRSGLPAPETWGVRARLLLAEGRSDWADILDQARRKKLPHHLCALVSARYARYLALHQQFQEADQQWEEAVGDACLAQRWTAASDWVFSRRVFRGRWAPFTSNSLHPIQLSLIDRGPSKEVIPTDSEALSGARAALLDDERRRAAILAQRALRDAVATGSWAAEMDACRLLGSILTPDKPDRAAGYLARAGDRKGMDALAERHTRRFIDIGTRLDGPNYWTIAASYRLLADQADLIPDDLVDGIARRLMQDLHAADKRTLVDLRGWSISRYLNAIHTLGALATRLPLETAEAALHHFETQAPVEPGHYRFHDKDEAIVVAGIARTQPTLRDRALKHLAPLLARSQPSRCSTTIEALDENFDDARPLLQSVDDQWAHEQLAYHDPALIDAEDAQEALRRLCVEAKHTPGMFTMGTNAVRDSLLVRNLSPDGLDRATVALLAKADDPWISSSDRAQYLIAAANLAGHLTEASRNRHFDAAIVCATSPSESLADQAMGPTSPLGAIRFSGGNDARPQATYLAAQLATTAEHRDAVRRIAFTLLGEPDTEESWVARALLRIQDSLTADVGFLSSRGPALRGLAAELWGPKGSPAPVGLRLARDEAMPVRRSLAANLGSSTGAQAEVRALLQKDPSHEVRTALKRSEPGDHA